MKTQILFFAAAVLVVLAASCENKKEVAVLSQLIGPGEVPSLASDTKNNIHIVYGKGDSILYALSKDAGQSFSEPQLVDTFPDLFSFAMRGPQIAATANGVCIIACNKEGDIFSYWKGASGTWQKTARVNDTDTTSKEGFLALGSNGSDNLFAAWIDLRKNQQNNIYGARSADGGKTWSSNVLVYESPDGHTCECCKPSTALYGNTVYVMFRNWLNGNRDLYLAQSLNGGTSFTQAEKLGRGSWKIDACPMDGGALSLAEDGTPTTVWRRENTIFTARPGQPETQIGEGRQCTLETLDGKNWFAWVEAGEVVVLSPEGVKQHLGKGSLPALKALSNHQLLCVWENKKQIQKAILPGVQTAAIF